MQFSKYLNLDQQHNYKKEEDNGIQFDKIQHKSSEYHGQVFSIQTDTPRVPHDLVSFMRVLEVELKSAEFNAVALDPIQMDNITKVCNELLHHMNNWNNIMLAVIKQRTDITLASMKTITDGMIGYIQHPENELVTLSGKHGSPITAGNYRGSVIVELCKESSQALPLVVDMSVSDNGVNSANSILIGIINNEILLTHTKLTQTLDAFSNSFHYEYTKFKSMVDEVKPDNYKVVEYNEAVQVLFNNVKEHYIENTIKTGDRFEKLGATLITALSDASKSLPEVSIPMDTDTITSITKY